MKLKLALISLIIIFGCKKQLITHQVHYTFYCENKNAKYQYTSSDNGKQDGDINSLTANFNTSISDDCSECFNGGGFIWNTDTTQTTDSIGIAVTMDGRTITNGVRFHHGLFATAQVQLSQFK